MVQLKRDSEYWKPMNWTESEQIEMDYQDGEMVDVYERVGK